MRSGALESAIWPKRATHGLKKCVLCTFYGKRTDFPIWGRFEAGRTILRSGAMQSDQGGKEKRSHKMW